MSKQVISLLGDSFWKILRITGCYMEREGSNPTCLYSILLLRELLKFFPESKLVLYFEELDKPLFGVLLQDTMFITITLNNENILYARFVNYDEFMSDHPTTVIYDCLICMTKSVMIMVDSLQLGLALQDCGIDCIDIN